MRCPEKKAFRDFIAARGLNMSRQRTLILEAFLSAGPRTNVDELYLKLRADHCALGRSTVYRTMKLMVECGIARACAASGAPVEYEGSRPRTTSAGRHGTNRRPRRTTDEAQRIDWRSK